MAGIIFKGKTSPFDKVIVLCFVPVRVGVGRSKDAGIVKVWWPMISLLLLLLSLLNDISTRLGLLLLSAAAAVAVAVGKMNPPVPPGVNVCALIIM